MWVAAVAAIVLTLAQSPGRISPDTKLDLTANPLRFLARAANLLANERKRHARRGGAAVQQGIQMIQNAMMVSGLRSASSARSAGAAGTAGGIVRAGAGLPQGDCK